MLLFLFSIFLTSNVSTAEAWAERNQQILDQLVKESKIDRKHFGLWVQKGQAKISVNAEQLFTPASVSKIPTALAFLQEFSTSKGLKTWIYKTGSIRDGVLNGDLYLKGGGDPTLVSENLWLMVKELKRNGFKRMTGQVFVDESYFDDDYFSDGRQKRRVDRAYDAPVSGLSMNWNSLSIYTRPGAKVADAVSVHVEPELPSLVITNTARTAPGTKVDLKVDRQILTDGRMKLVVSGQMGLAAKEKAFYKSVADASLYAGENFLALLKREGFQVPDQVSKRVTPVEADLLVESEGWEIPRVVAALSKFSNNFVAEAMTKHLGKREGVPAQLEDGLEKIRAYLQSMGWQKPDYIFKNPSGFTHDNKMRADRLGDLLVKARDQFHIAPEFLSSLPISGVDGTLERRLSQVMKAKVRAKTGYMGGVVSLAGYLQAIDNSEPLTFVFFYNGPVKHDWMVRDHFDKILWRLYQNSKNAG